MFRSAIDLEFIFQYFALNIIHAGTDLTLQFDWIRGDSLNYTNNDTTTDWIQGDSNQAIIGACALINASCPKFGST